MGNGKVGEEGKGRIGSEDVVGNGAFQELVESGVLVFEGEMDSSGKDDVGQELPDVVEVSGAERVVLGVQSLPPSAIFLGSKRFLESRGPESGQVFLEVG